MFSRDSFVFTFALKFSNIRNMMNILFKFHNSSFPIILHSNGTHNYICLKSNMSFYLSYIVIYSSYLYLFETNIIKMLYSFNICIQIHIPWLKMHRYGIITVHFISNPFPPLISLIYMQILARWDFELCSQLRQSSWHSNYNGQKGSNKLFCMKSNYLFELQTELLFFRLLAMQKNIMQKIFRRSKLRTKWKTRKM